MKQLFKKKKKLTKYERERLWLEIVTTVDAYVAIAVIAAMITLVPAGIIIGAVKLITMLT